MSNIQLHADVTHSSVEIIKAIEQVADEISSQDHKWGPDRNHTPQTWMQILTEEVGEAAQQGNHVIFGTNSIDIDRQCLVDMEYELIQVAAVAIQAVASLRRQKDSVFTP